jgi:uncharacterized membrane protein (UPF0182 family)
MFDEFMEELRRRQAARDDSGTRDGKDTGSSRARASENPLEDEKVSSSGSGPDDFDRDEGRTPWSIFERGGGGPRRRSGGPSDEFPEFHISKGWIIGGAIVVTLLVLLSAFTISVGLITDAMWFNSVGYSDVFWTRVGSQILYFAVGGLFAFLFLWLNLWLAGRFIPKGQMRRFSLDDFLDRFNLERYSAGAFGQAPRPTPRSRTVGGSADAITVPEMGRPVFWVLLGIGALIALGLGAMANGGWSTIQLFLHRTPFGQTDPSSNLDISFYMFELPFYRLVQSYVSGLLTASLALVGLRYLFAVVSGASMPTASRAHLGLLAMLFLWVGAAGLQLDRYELVYSNTSGIFQGVSYTDAQAKVTAINAMTVISAFIGCFILGFAITRWRVPLFATLFVWVAAFGILQVAYPQLIQRFSVEPNQQTQEAPYIQNNINMTRLGFGLDAWQPIQYEPKSTVTKAAVESEPSTMQNVRLWDYRPLGKTLDQLQVIRNYYSFSDVDTDRYVFTEAAACAPAAPPCVRQVMLAGRDFDPEKYASKNEGDVSWVNLHISYTHGVGLVMVPVNEVAKGGQPVLIVKDLPPASSAGAPKINQPRIYFGTSPTNYVIVNAVSQEFDYPSSDCAGCGKYTNWTGNTGIKLDTPLTRLLFAARFGDLNMLISDQITGSSQLLYNRSIQDRVDAIAPFLRYDKDPYLVVTSQGKLVYVLDAFTTSNMFPNANNYDPGSDSVTNGLAGDPFNYVRNSVKVVMDAYDGTITFYIADTKDPIIKAWQGVFPGMFKPISEMQVDVRGDATNIGHLRYPEDMFNAQTMMYEKYHVTDPVVFYKQDDVWLVPKNSGSSSGGGANPPEQLPLEAYYVQMRIPGQANPEFLLLQPMALSGRTNMIAWVAAHNDPEKYGQVSVFDFPVGANVIGPAQMEGLIASNETISKDISLWAQGGSQVILGNLLVIPLQDSLLYIEPVYLVSTTNPIPVFQRVVVATQTQVVWAPTLQEALNLIYSGQGAIPDASPPPGSTATPGPQTTPTTAVSPTPLPSIFLNGDVQALVAQMSAHFDAAQTAAGKGDWVTYGKEMDIVQQLIDRLGATVGTPAPAAP